MRFAHAWRGKWTIIHSRPNDHVAVQYSRGCSAATTPRSTRPLDWNETMNAPMTQDQLTYSLGKLSYVDYSYDEPPVTTVEAPAHGIGHWLGRIVAAFAGWRRRQATLREMDLLTERELSRRARRTIGGNSREPSSVPGQLVSGRAIAGLSDTSETPGTSGKEARR